MLPPEKSLPSWALVISTYRRRAVLVRCLKTSLSQTVPPAEVVVVDASPDWAENRELVMREIAPQYPNVRWVYVEAEIRMLPAQRNQGIALSTADVLFMIDDDSLMFPDCAEQIMKIYAADVNKKIASIGAKDVSDQAPDEPNFNPPPADAPAAHTPLPTGFAGFKQNLKWQFSRLFDRGEESFIPYPGHWPAQTIPPECLQFDLTPVNSLNGYRMTFRREVIAAEKFVGWFIGSAPFEDIDATHRASRHGAVVQANRARLCHLLYHSGRLDHYTLAALWVMNGAILHRLFGDDKPSLAKRWNSRTRRRLPLEFTKDLLKGRWNFPAFRGLLFGRRHLKKINSMSPAELEAWYPAIQKALRESQQKSTTPAASPNAQTA